MPIDPAGTKPGVQAQPPQPKVVNWRCKNQKCDSMQATEIPMPGNTGRHIYRCIKCNTTWGVQTGGGIDLG